MTTGKTIALTIWIFVGKVTSLLLNMLPQFVIAFPPRSKCLLISWLQSPSAVIWEPKKRKISRYFHCFPSICHEVMGPDAIIFICWLLNFKPAFSLYSFPFIKRLFHSSFLSAIRLLSLQIWSYWCFPHQSWFQLVLHPAWHFAWCTLHKN